MRIIEITVLPNGAHRNQNGFIGEVPGGWAVIPEDMTIPSTFPFVDISVEDGVVTSMTAGTVPEPEPEPEPVPTLEDRITALETDAAQAANDRAALKLLLTGVDSE